MKVIRTDMVFLQPTIFSTLHHRLSSPPSYSRLSVTGITAVFFLLVIVCVPLASADDPVAGIPCHSPHITNVITSTSPTGYAPLTITFTPQVTDCYECTYLWSITESVAGGLGTNYYHDRELTHTFSEPGGHTVQLRIFENLPVCNGESSEATIYQSVSLREPGVIITPTQNADCPDISTMTLSVYQAAESSELIPPGSSSRLPFWSPTLVGSCPNCAYTWSLFKMTDTYEPVPLDSGDLSTSYGRTVLQHRFREPGTYKIYVRMTNAEACPYIGDSRPYLWGSVLHHVTAPVTTTTIPVAMAVPQDVLSQVTVTTTMAPGVTTAVPVATTVITAITTPHQSTTVQVNPGLTPPVIATQVIVPTYAGSGTQTETPAGTPELPAPDESARSVPATSATRSPGFGLPLVLGAGLVVLVLRRK